MYQGQVGVLKSHNSENLMERGCENYILACFKSQKKNDDGMLHSEKACEHIEHECVILTQLNHHVIHQ